MEIFPLFYLNFLRSSGSADVILAEQFVLLHLPDGDLSVLFASSTENVPVLSRAERRDPVAVTLELLQDLVALGVYDVNLPFSGTEAQTPDPHLEGMMQRYCNI